MLIKVSKELYNYIDQLKEILEMDSHEEIIWSLIDVTNIEQLEKYENSNVAYQ